MEFGFSHISSYNACTIEHVGVKINERHVLYSTKHEAVDVNMTALSDSEQSAQGVRDLGVCDCPPSNTFVPHTDTLCLHYTEQQRRPCRPPLGDDVAITSGHRPIGASTAGGFRGLKGAVVKV